MFGIITDIETIGDVTQQGVGPTDEEIAAPGNILDPVKIKARERDNLDKWLDRLPLDWRTANIAAVGFLAPMQASDELHLYIAAPLGRFLDGLGDLELPVDNPIIVRVDDERELLSTYWRDLQLCAAGASSNAGRGLAGFQIREFDFPMLILRSCLLGIVPGVQLKQLAKYRDWIETGVLDIHDHLRAWDRFKMNGWGLAEYAELFGLDIRPYGAGAEFPAKYNAGDYRWCLKHLAHDILCAGELLGRMAPMLA